MTDRMRDLIQSYTAAVENEVKADAALVLSRRVAEGFAEAEKDKAMGRWTQAKTRRAERRAALVDAIERLEANQKC